MRISKGHLISNYASLLILGSAGILINLTIAHFYPSSSLGLFNQVFSFFFIVTQMSTGGLQFAVLRKVASNQEDASAINHIVTSSLVMNLVTSILINGSLYVLSDWIGRLFESVNLGYGLRVITLAIFFNSINKILQSTLNGLQRMHSYAIAQTLRMLSLFLLILAMSIYKVDDKELVWSIFFAELITFLFLIFKLRSVLLGPITINIKEIKELSKFGIKGMFSGILIELNLKADIFVLGYFLSDSRIGVYSFAAMFAEGYSQFLNVIRNLFNPEIAKLANSNPELLKDYIRNWQIKIFASLAIVGLLIVFGVLLILRLLPDLAVYNEALLLLAILLVGVWITSPFAPFDGLLIQGGYPGRHSLYNLSQVTINVLFNIIGVTILELKGAALGTFLANILCSFILICIIKKTYKNNVLIS